MMDDTDKEIINKMAEHLLSMADQISRLIDVCKRLEVRVKSLEDESKSKLIRLN